MLWGARKSRKVLDERRMMKNKKKYRAHPPGLPGGVPEGETGKLPSPTHIVCLLCMYVCCIYIYSI